MYVYYVAYRGTVKIIVPFRSYRNSITYFGKEWKSFSILIMNLLFHQNYGKVISFDFIFWQTCKACFICATMWDILAEMRLQAYELQGKLTEWINNMI